MIKFGEILFFGEYLKIIYKLNDSSLENILGKDIF